MEDREMCRKSQKCVNLYQFVLLLLFATVSEVRAVVPALFIFGDSTVDTGTNIYINTTNDFKSDISPYGQDFFGKPTGRFCNGRVIVDFIAEYAGLPFVSPYLQPDADHSHGANFGSGGAGVLPDTNKGLVVDLQRQLRQFAELQGAVMEKHGEIYASKFFSDAVYIVSVGSNDYLGGYLGNPAQQQKYTPEQFVGLVVQGFAEALQTLYSKRARKLMVFEVGPIGCLPALRAISQSDVCVDGATQLSMAHNGGVALVLNNLQAALPDLTILRGHFFPFFMERLNDPTAHDYGYNLVVFVAGFKDGERACCGTGPYGGSGHCGRDDKTTGANFELCTDSNEYIWWDPYHPTERVHEQFAKIVWNGSMPYVGPLNANELFRIMDAPLCEDDLNTHPGNPITDVIRHIGK